MLTRIIPSSGEALPVNGPGLGDYSIQKAPRATPLFILFYFCKVVCVHFHKFIFLNEDRSHLAVHYCKTGAEDSIFNIVLSYQPVIAAHVLHRGCQFWMRMKAQVQFVAPSADGQLAIKFVHIVTSIHGEIGRCFNGSRHSLPGRNLFQLPLHFLLKMGK